MSLPVVRAIKAALPDADIYITGREFLAPVFTGIPEIAAFLPLPEKSTLFSLWKSAQHLRACQYDAGILLPNSFHSALLFRLAGIPRIFGYNKDGRSLLLNSALPYPSDPQLHQITFYLDLAFFFLKTHLGKAALQGMTAGNFSEMMTMGDDEKQRIRRKLEALGVSGGGEWLGISPSAAYGTAKQWLPERFAGLIDCMLADSADLKILLFGSVKDREQTGRIARLAAGDRKRVVNLAGLLNLRETFAAISLCSLFLGNDSGLMHAASSLRTPLAVIFGPTPLTKAAPLPHYNANVRILHHPQACAPCKHRDCPLPGHPCMAAVTVEEVYAALRELR